MSLLMSSVTLSEACDLSGPLFPHLYQKGVKCLVRIYENFFLSLLKKLGIPCS